MVFTLDYNMIAKEWEKAVILVFTNRSPEGLPVIAFWCLKGWLYVPWTGSIPSCPFWERHIWGLCGKLLVHLINSDKVEAIVYNPIAKAYQPGCNCFNLFSIDGSANSVTKQQRFPLWACQLFVLVLLLFIPR